MQKGSRIQREDEESGSDIDRRQGTVPQFEDRRCEEDNKRNGDESTR